MTMEEMQQERRQRIKDYCTSKNLNEPISQKKIPDMMVDDKDGILLCVTYKVASRQLKRIIGALTNVKIGRYAPRGLFNWFNQYTQDEKEHMARTYFKFLFVREPLDRLLSGFLDKFYREPHPMYRLMYGKNIIRKYRANATAESLEKGHDVTFNEFAQFILDGNRNEHWDQFYRRCHPCAVDYDFIGYFESLEQELPYVFKAAGVGEVPLQIPYVSHNTSSKVHYYYSQLPREKIIQLAELYRLDYEVFGYSFPGPLFEDLVGDGY